MRCLIADLVVELEPVYDETKTLAKPFLYSGSRETDIALSYTEKYFQNLLNRRAQGVTEGEMENFAFSNMFNRRAIKFSTMLVHSSALIYNGGAYLFSADSGVGKSFHTRLWLKAFGNKVHIMNDDKPVVRLYDDRAIAFGTPFDGGSRIALNESYPLKAIVFLERGEQNSVRVPDSKEVIQRLYFQTAHMVSMEIADKMLKNFEKLLSLTSFYILTCNMEDEAARVAFDGIIKQ